MIQYDLLIRFGPRLHHGGSPKLLFLNLFLNSPELPSPYAVYVYILLCIYYMHIYLHHLSVQQVPLSHHLTALKRKLSYITLNLLPSYVPLYICLSVSVTSLNSSHPFSSRVILNIVVSPHLFSMMQQLPTLQLSTMHNADNACPWHINILYAYDT